MPAGLPPSIPIDMHVQVDALLKASFNIIFPASSSIQETWIEPETCGEATTSWSNCFAILLGRVWRSPPVHCKHARKATPLQNPTKYLWRAVTEGEGSLHAGLRGSRPSGGRGWCCKRLDSWQTIRSQVVNILTGMSTDPPLLLDQHPRREPRHINPPSTALQLTKQL